MPHPRLSTSDLIAAFDADGYEVVERVHWRGWQGLRAEHRTAENAHTGQMKTAFYLEGSPHALGWLMGRLAEPEIARMTEEYLVNIVPAFLDQAHIEVADPSWAWLLELLLEIVKRVDDDIQQDVPRYLVREIRGMARGCRAANRDTPVDFEKLWALNVGVDLLLAVCYAPDRLLSLGIDPRWVRPPISCNAFSAWGQATVDGTHYFGRDFMFPAAGVFHEVAAMVILNPSSPAGSLPLVSMTAPGFAGAASAMNTRGVAGGVLMVPGASNDPDRPGFNSLLLLRHLVQRAPSATRAVSLATRAQRGVSWLYALSDGIANRAVVIEAGAATPHLDPLAFTPAGMRDLLPDHDALTEDPVELRRGLVARWEDYALPRTFLEYNPALFAHEGCTFRPGIFHEVEPPGHDIGGADLPGPFSFAPLSTNLPDLVAAANTYQTPTMRLTSMHRTTAAVVGDEWSDLDWRYATLTRLLRQNHGSLDADKAREIIDMLALDGLYPEYYWWDGEEPADWRRQRIDGCVSLFDCTHLTVTSHWGDYGDAWVSLDLSRYLPPRP